MLDYIITYIYALDFLPLSFYHYKEGNHGKIIFKHGEDDF